MMKQEDLFKKLGLILNELNEQYRFLAENPQQMSELELELFHANANFLAEHAQIIKKINLVQAPPLSIASAESQNEISTADLIDGDEMQEECMIEDVAFPDELPLELSSPEQTPPEPEISAIEEEIFKLDPEPSTFEFILNDHSEHERFEFEEKSVDELFNRPLSEDEEKILEQKRKIASAELDKSVEEFEEDEIGPEPFLVHKEEEFPITEEELTLEEAPVSTIEVNKVEPVEDPTYRPTLNDLLAKTKSSSSINSTSTTSVKDLKSSINLNDKLLYIKDLFNGYNLAYAEAIELANKLPNFEAADNFFQKNYAVKNNWAEKQGTVDQFYALLNQRFS